MWFLGFSLFYNKPQNLNTTHNFSSKIFKAKIFYSDYK